MSHISGSARTARAGGGMIFASAMLMVAGVFQILMGIQALDNRGFFRAVRTSYTYRFSVHSWGIVHVIVGGVVLLTAIGLLSGSRWARGVAVAVTALAAISNFFFIPYYPIWTLLIIAVDVFVIWTLANTPSQERMGTGSRMMDAGTLASGDRWTTTNQAGYDMSAEQQNLRRAPDMQSRGDLANQPRGDMASHPRGDGQREQQQPMSGRQPGT